MSDLNVLYRTVTCEYITPNGYCESLEFFTSIGFCKRILNLWSVLQEQVKSSCKYWPDYVWKLFWNDSLSDVECCQLASFIVVNDITSSVIVQWFGLVGLAKKKRQIVFDMVRDILMNPQNFTFVYAFCGRAERHVQVESLAYSTNGQQVPPENKGKYILAG